MLITAIERQQAELAKDLEERQLEAERKAEELLEELEKEIHELQTRAASCSTWSSRGARSTSYRSDLSAAFYRLSAASAS